MLSNFSFVIPGILAGCGQPGVFSSLRNDLAELAAKGIGAIVTLTERRLDPEELKARGFASLHLPIADFTPPTGEQIDRFVEFVDERTGAEVGVVVHCGAGMGRTGTLLACYLVKLGRTDREAIEQVRRARPGSIETAEQERAVGEYYRRLGGGKRK